MPISDELEALRQTGRVKKTSSALQSSASTFNFTTPAEQEAIRKLKSKKDQQLREEAKQYLRKPKHAGMNDLLYRKLRDLKRKQAERERRKWEKKSVGKDDGDGGNANDEVDEQGHLDTLEMLPEHLVSALKAKYETTNAVEALDRALKDDDDKDEEGKGFLDRALAQAAEEAANADVDNDDEVEAADSEVANPDEVATDSAAMDLDDEATAAELSVDSKGDERVSSEEAEAGGTADYEEVQVEDAAQEEANLPNPEESDTEKIANETESSQEATPVEIGDEEKKDTMDLIEAGMVKLNISSDNVDEKESQEEPTEDNLEEEEIPSEQNVEKTNDSSTKEFTVDAMEAVTNNPTESSVEPSLPPLSNEEKIQSTKQFYNSHAYDYIAKITQAENKLLPPTHRNAFLGYINQQQMIMKALSPSKQKPSTPSDEASPIPEFPSYQIVDLGCGHGTDTLHFSSLGHHLLSVDFSINLLNHAKGLAPKAHYLHMDMRDFSKVLLPESLDGIWANASLLHLPKADAKAVLSDLRSAVKVGGVLYFNLKLGAEVDVVGEAGERFELDARYSTNGEGGSDVGNARKLYSYFNLEEVKEMVKVTGWEMLEIGVDDCTNLVDYATHPFAYVFATRKRDA
mmetsp:Transcript_13246/g.28004  ORF Transcript_13246/g.28004 Transcript_13246/m.28004 type:complete len:630 (+) Transcript_13246:381-2270(+)|eukprot:CAMPEP_0171334676 /NCGR_PEP_ID=MMETSP0878-20121228/4818_1 /TAXON_ID=67004 /ORGANISM="Thalassiosira weissflogii, Strain CCMP1336" /LENGTH=629 /DNA_ID=CAMNT_0011835809 /DNA_START=317 /DNA_END=2206 /DNA_ORIENTATION=-